MILNPRPGSIVQIWYRPGLRDWMPYHGRHARVIVASRGRPRNHLVRLRGGILVVVPCGNIRSAGEPQNNP